MKTINAAFALLLGVSTTAFAGLSCTDLKYGNDKYHRNMEALAKQARLEGDYFNRYHEDVVRHICDGKAKEVKRIVDRGYVKASEVEAIRETIGKGTRSEVGQSYGYSKKKFSAMGLCSACADNVAQHYTAKPASQCGQLAKRALEGNPQAIEKLQTFPPFCQWSYR